MSENQWQWSVSRILLCPFLFSATTSHHVMIHHNANDQILTTSTTPTPIHLRGSEIVIQHSSIKMGIKKGSLTLHSITNLMLVDVAHICRQLAEKNDISTLKVVTDCSNLVYIFKDSHTPVAISLANFFHKFTSIYTFGVDSYLNILENHLTKCTLNDGQENKKKMVTLSVVCA